MILSGQQIERLIKNGEIVISPDSEIKEASIKIHFSESFTLKPKEFRVTKTKEAVSLPSNLAGLYDGYVKLSTQGVMTHAGSMFIDPGFNGQITLEVFNASNNEITIHKNDRSGHLIIVEVKQ